MKRHRVGKATRHAIAAKGDWVALRDPNKRVMWGGGVFKVESVGRTNIKVSQDVRFSPTGPWFHQVHTAPIGHIERVVDASEVAPRGEIP